MGERRNANGVLVEKPEERSQLGSLRRRWEDDIKMDLLEVEWGMDWIDLVQDRDKWRVFVNAVMNRLVP
jgi:hypothetical protein